MENGGPGFTPHDISIGNKHTKFSMLTSWDAMWNTPWNCHATCAKTWNPMETPWDLMKTPWDFIEFAWQLWLCERFSLDWHHFTLRRSWVIRQLLHTCWRTARRQRLRQCVVKRLCISQHAQTRLKSCAFWFVHVLTSTPEPRYVYHWNQWIGRALEIMWKLSFCVPDYDGSC